MTRNRDSLLRRGDCEHGYVAAGGSFDCPVCAVGCCGAATVEQCTQRPHCPANRGYEPLNADPAGPCESCDELPPEFPFPNCKCFE